MQGLMSILLTIFVISVQSKELPEYLRNARCHINEGFEKCIKDNGNKIIPQVAEGVPELHIPSANPLKLDFIQLINTQQLQVTVTNVEVYGLNETVIVNAKSDSRKGEFKLLLANKNITIVGKYSANGKVLVLPVVGEGKFSICLKEGIFNETTFTQLVNRDGDDYIKLMDLILSAHFQGVIFDFQNLFNGNKQLAEYIKKARCHIDENIEQCMKVNGNKILRQLISEGVPEFNLPSMNPLKVDFIQMINTPQLQVNVSKMEVHGLTEMTIIEAKAKPAEGVFKASLINKNITVVGKYTANGKILTFPVVGEGDFSIYLKNGLYNETVICRMVKRNGDDYLERMNIFLTANFERVVSDFRNLFNGNKQLGDQFNMLLNENWEYLISEYGPSVVQFLKNLMGNLFDSFTSNVPFKNLFLFD